MMSVSLMSLQDNWWNEIQERAVRRLQEKYHWTSHPANKLDVNEANVQQTMTLFNGGNKHKSHKPEVINLFQPLMTTMKCFSCLAWNNR